jgi:hypothetical protein
MTKTYDAIIIGTGQAGPFLAQRRSRTGSARAPGLTWAYTNGAIGSETQKVAE